MNPPRRGIPVPSRAQVEIPRASLQLRADGIRLRPRPSSHQPIRGHAHGLGDFQRLARPLRQLRSRSRLKSRREIRRRRVVRSRDDDVAERLVANAFRRHPRRRVRRRRRARRHRWHRFRERAGDESAARDDEEGASDRSHSLGMNRNHLGDASTVTTRRVRWGMRARERARETRFDRRDATHGRTRASEASEGRRARVSSVSFGNRRRRARTTGRRRSTMVRWFEITGRRRRRRRRRWEEVGGGRARARRWDRRRSAEDTGGLD